MNQWKFIFKINLEPRKAKVHYSDSDDDDDFLDRTGDVEKKRLKKLAATENAALSYEELLERETELLKKIAGLEEKMEEYRLNTKLEKVKQANADDDLDSFMNNLTEEKQLDKSDVRKMKVSGIKMRTTHVLMIIN